MAGRVPARSRPPALAVAAVAVVVLALLGTLVVALRGEPGETVLGVNGWSLARTDLRDELGQIAANDGYRAARGREGKPLAVFRPGSTTDYDPALVVELLNERVTFQLAADEVARRGLVASDADRAAALAVIEDGFAPAGASGTPGSPPGTAGGRSVLDAFGSYRDVLVTGVTNLRLLQRALGLGTGVSDDDAARVLYDRSRSQVALQTCVRHLLVRAGPVPDAGTATTTTSAPPTDADFAAALERAEGLKARIDAGEDFASVTMRNSDDGSSRPKGGDLGCAPRSRYERAFDDAVWATPVGEVSAPVRSTYGYHLVLPYERRERTYEELLPSLKAAVGDQGQEALQQWLREAAKRAQVSVDAGVGRWNASNGMVELPEGVSSIDLVPQGAGPAAPTGTAPAAGAVPTAPPASPPGGPR
jgi:hypothetical protein